MRLYNVHARHISVLRCLKCQIINMYFVQILIKEMVMSKSCSSSDFCLIGTLSHTETRGSFVMFMRPDSLLRLWRYINHFLTCLLAHWLPVRWRVQFKLHVLYDAFSFSFKRPSILAKHCSSHKCWPLSTPFKISIINRLFTSATAYMRILSLASAPFLTLDLPYGMHSQRTYVPTMIAQFLGNNSKLTF